MPARESEGEKHPQSRPVDSRLWTLNTTKSSAKFTAAVRPIHRIAADTASRILWVRTYQRQPRRAANPRKTTQLRVAETGMPECCKRSLLETSTERPRGFADLPGALRSTAIADDEAAAWRLQRLDWHVDRLA